MEIIEVIKKIKKKEKIKINEIITLVGGDSFYQILFLVTFITSIPAPSWGFGTSTMPGGIISLIIGIQLILEYNYLVLPDFIGNKEIQTKYLKNTYLEKIKNLLNKLKKNTKKRFEKIFNYKHINKILGFVIILQSILMIIPIIFTNLFPSMFVTIISFCYLIKDGLLLCIFSILSVIVFFLYIFFFKYIIKYLKFLSNKFFKTSYKY